MISPLGKKTFSEYKEADNKSRFGESYKIELSRIDDIEEVINRGLGLEEFVENDLDEAFTMYIRAKDTVRFDMNDAYTEGEQLLNDFEQEIKDLGLDLPSEFKQLQTQLNDLDKLISDSEQRLKDF
jgi:uncharacterized phage infection (PIP) family protein YhgE|tara:strand:+ start:12 stop:389 length:378 start_codon:yes stop_codon:yes gene_type:complete